MQQYREFPFFQPSDKLKVHAFLIYLVADMLLSLLSPNWGAATLLCDHSFPFTFAFTLAKHSNLLCFGLWQGDAEAREHRH